MWVHRSAHINLAKENALANWKVVPFRELFARSLRSMELNAIFAPSPKIGAAKAVAVAFVGPMQFLTVKIFLLLRSAQGKGHKANGCNLLGACYGAYTRCRHLPLWTLLISCKQIFKCSAGATPSHHNNNNSNKNN